MQNEYTLGVIGAGNMASAIIGGILSKRLLSPNQIAVADADACKLTHLTERGIYTSVDNKYVASHCTHLLFAVKPQTAPAVFEEIKNVISAQHVISIMAGITLSQLRTALGNRKYIRIMPNTPALIGEGMSVIAFDTDAESEFVIDVFRSIGKVEILAESNFDAVTSLSGSGPAYVYTFIKSMIDGGIEGGLSEDISKTLALQTVIGAAKMIESSDKPIDALIQAVCSKGGTTIEAIESFKRDGLDDTVKRGMGKCRLRSIELANNRK